MSLLGSIQRTLGELQEALAETTDPQVAEELLEAKQHLINAEELTAQLKAKDREGP